MRRDHFEKDRGNRPIRRTLRKCSRLWKTSFLAADSRVSLVNELSFESAEVSSELTNSLGTEVSSAYQYQVIAAQITMRDNGEVYDDYRVEIVYDLDDFGSGRVRKASGYARAGPDRRQIC